VDFEAHSGYAPKTGNVALSFSQRLFQLLLQLVCVEDTISGKTDRRGRQLGKMIRGAGQGVGWPLGFMVKVQSGKFVKSSTNHHDQRQDPVPDLRFFVGLRVF
jgi:hypothetical protein